MTSTQQRIRKLFQKGLAQTKAGHKAEARNYFRQVLELAPNNDTTWLYLAGVSDNPANAFNAIQQAEALNPNNPGLTKAQAWFKETWPDYSNDRRPPTADRRPTSAVSDQPSVVGDQQSTVSGQPSALAKFAAFIPSAGSGRSPHPSSLILSSFSFLLQKLAFGALVLSAITYLSYLGLDMARGASFGQALGQAMTKSLACLGRLLQGNPGLTAAGTIAGLPTPVSEVLPGLLAKSLGLLGVSLAIASLVGVTLGILAARKQRSGWSLWIIVASIVGVSIPSFFAALLLQMLMIQWTRRSGSPLLPVAGFGWDKHLVLPALVLAARPVAQITRMTFVSMGEIFDQDYVRVARSKGLRGASVLFRHALPNAAVPILTTIGLSLRFSLSSLPVVELFFGWPGVGYTLLKSISLRDDNLTVALALSLGALFIGVNLLLDVSYRLLDPRLREMVKRVNRRSAETLAVRFKHFLADTKDVLADNPVNRWFKQRHQSDDVGQTVSLSRRNGGQANSLSHKPLDKRIKAERRRAFLRGTLGNFPFMAGAILTALLVGLVFFGPKLAPHSPYTTQGLVIENGEMRVPPFEPNDTYAWGTDALGRDIKSLIFAGAQQTLTLAALVVLLRMLVGAILGALAGWQRDSWLDRLILAAAEIISAFPALLLAMILILAIGVRQGMRPFVIALGFVGWGEVMQFVRSETLKIKPKTFIESAVAVGLRAPRILLSHVLPNLIPALVSIAALEMGAALMILGELGFIGVFIGGGAFAELDIGLPPYHYSDVPEWGALLSNVRVYARSYPWTAIYPALAFFIAILGFNLLGEGTRRLLDKVGVGITRVVNRYTVAVAALLLVGFVWAQSNAGSIAFYRQYVEHYDAAQAMAHAQRLGDPALRGRPLGDPAMESAAQYVADQFQALKLQPAGGQGGYLFRRPRAYQQLGAVPQFSIGDGGSALVYHQDYTAYPGRNRNLGEAEGTIRVFSAGPLSQSGGFFGGNFPVLKDKAWPDEILMVLNDRDTFLIEDIPRQGVLVVAEDDADITRNHTLSTRDPIDVSFGTKRQRGQDAPVLWITQSTADRLLSGTGQNIAGLRLIADGLIEDQLINFSAQTSAAMSVTGTVVNKFYVNHVIATLPGAAGKAEGAGVETQMDDQMIVVMAPYDSPPPDPDGLERPAANDNASGVAVMLEAIRVMQESGYQPNRTFLFVAYSAQGKEGGEDVSRPDPSAFLKARSGFAATFKI
ncbi:MAG TPA: ABC transporter permease subunit, partial [Chloroflexi bacterium]|nr:ABC transporter permease subunit [Chloroflexota bacterium]